MSIVIMYCVIYAIAREYIASRIKLVGATMSQWHKAFALTAGAGIVGLACIVFSDSGWQFGVSWSSVGLMSVMVCVGLIRKISSIHACREADRSAYMVFEIGMLPLLFGLQWLRGTSLGLWEVGGMIVIMSMVVVLFVSRVMSLHGFRHLVVDGVCLIVYSVIAYILLQSTTNAYTLQTLQAMIQLIIIGGVLLAGKHISRKPVLTDARLIQFGLVSGVVQYCYYSALSHGEPSVVNATTLSISLVIALLVGRKIFGESAILPKFSSAMMMLVGVGCLYVPISRMVGA